MNQDIDAPAETEFFLGDRPLYVSLYHGRSPDWLVIVPPLFEELARTRKLLVNTARRFADAGFSVARFDYYGTGLSEGRFEDFSLSQARRDLENVLALCRERGMLGCSLLGFRFGAYLAAQQAPRMDGARTVLWEPVLDPAAYIAECLKTSAVDQIVTYGAVRFSHAELMQRLEREGRVTINGYALSRVAVEEFRRARALREADCAGCGIVLWRRSSLESLAFTGPDVVFRSKVRVAWDHIKFLDHDESGELAGTTLALLGRQDESYETNTDCLRELRRPAHEGDRL